jgi:4-hydroxybenzoate polyprenyltransferase
MKWVRWIFIWTYGIICGMVLWMGGPFYPLIIGSLIVAALAFVVGFIQACRKNNKFESS